MGKDRSVSHHNPSPSHLADEHSCCSFAELQTQTHFHSGLGETHTASTVISAPTVTISSDNTDNADTQPTSMDEDDAFGDSKSEGSATDRACYGADSDSSNHFESSDRSSSGSPDPATTTHKLSGLAEWVKPGPGEEKESGTVSQQPHIEYPKDILIEPQGPTTASQSGTPKTANHAQKRKNATSQDKASQPQVLPRGEQSVTSAFQSSLPGTANLSRERRNASLYEEPHELQSVRTHLKASPHAEPAPASSYTVDLEAANPNAIGHNGVPPASPSQDNAEVQNEPGRDSPVVKLFKRIITVVGLVAALVFGIVACINKLDLLLACTIVIMIAGVDSMIQDF